MAKAKKILIIEDDEHLSRIYDIKFAKEKLPTVLATDGEEGLKATIEHKPAVVLLDLMLPKRDGFWVLEEMKKRGLLKGIRVIVLSNLGQRADIDRAMKLGAAEYLVKVDHSIQEVVDFVKKALA